MNLLQRFALCLATHTLLAATTIAQTQGPIRIVADVHADPMHAYPAIARRAVFEEWVTWTQGLLDELEPLGVDVSFLSCGEFAEYVLDDGSRGIGARLLRRLHRMGGQIGSHSHDEHQVGPHQGGLVASRLHTCRRT